MSKDEEKRLDGQSFHPGHIQALLEILNGGPEPGRVSVEERFRVVKAQRKGKIFVSSTIEEMSERNDHSKFWSAFRVKRKRLPPGYVTSSDKFKPIPKSVSNGLAVSK